MRNCPHCGKEIQDEAAFCRFCRHDVEPPLWLTSLQKCPFCAEWVERGIERCPLCGKALITEEPFYISEEEDSKERLLREVRQNIFSKNRDDTELEEEPEEEPGVTPAFQSIPRRIEADPGSSNDPFDGQQGLGVLRQHPREQAPFNPVEELDPRKVDKPRLQSRVYFPLGKVLPWVLLIVATIVVITVAMYAFQKIGPLGSLGLEAGPTPSELASPAPSETADQAVLATPTFAAAVLPPEATESGAPGACLLWSEITAAMEGQKVCAYGIIKRRFRVDDEIPYMAIFSEVEGTFAIVDRGTFYTQFQSGDCIQTSGEIEMMRGVRPYIDAQNKLSACSPQE